MVSITIHTDKDLKPPGKRTVRIVGTASAFGKGRQIRWYVSGRIYRELPVNFENKAITYAWLKAETEMKKRMGSL